MGNMRRKVRDLIWPILFLGLVGCAPMNQVRYPAARWVQDDDKRPVSKPKSREQYRFADIAEYQFFYPLENMVNLRRQGENLLSGLGVASRQEALNTNNFDEVADSTWFTNRLGRRPMSLPEILKGPDRSEGPDPKGPWTVLAAKTEGISPGFFIQDAAGEKYLLKFDPPGHLNLATSAEYISTKIFFAAGYNVAENYLVDFEPKILKLSETATRKNKKGKKVPLTQADLDDIFHRLPPLKEGVYRALATQILPGEPLGPFSFQGRRGSDPNDRIPHEHRRELRGYRVFSSLVDHFDARQANTLDTFIATGPEGKGYVRHHLIDFGSTLGSSAVKPKDKAHRNDYAFNYGKVGASLVTLGGYYPDWDKVPDSGLLSVAVFESKTFRPETWRAQYPHPAFQNMTPRDAFWAAKILIPLSDDQIRGIVRAAKYSDPQAADYVAQTLIERREKILKVWLSKMNPLDDFQWQTDASGGRLSFTDLMVRASLRPPARHRYRLVGKSGDPVLISWTETAGTSLQMSADQLEVLKEGRPYLLQLQTIGDGEVSWGPKIDLVLKREGDVRLVGLYRHY